MSFFQSFRAVRWLRSTNLLLQAILFVTFFAGLNYLALHYAWRFDLTQLRRHSLSAETRAYLSQLDKPLRIVVPLPQNTKISNADSSDDSDQINNDIAGLLREYAYALESNPRSSLQIDSIDVHQRPREAEQLGLQPDALLFICGDLRQPVPVSDLYQRKNNQRVAFIGERAFTAAILAVSNPVKKKIYFLTGHGEMDINSVDFQRGLSEIRQAITDRNYEIDTLNLAHARSIPEKADLVISVGAQNRYEPYEQEILRQYMTTRAGRLLILSSPGIASIGLDDLLGEWGILADNAWVLDSTSSNQLNFSGDLVLTNFTSHSITQVIRENQLALRFGATRPMRPNPTRVTDPGLSVSPLALTSTTAWGEHDYLQRRRTFQRNDSSANIPGPFAVATVAERIASNNTLPFSVPVGRIAAFGCSDFIANGRLRAGANSTIFFSTVNWLVDRDTQINVPARPIEKFQLALSRDQLSRLRFVFIFGAPGAFALLGLIVYWTRRR